MKLGKHKGFDVTIIAEEEYTSIVDALGFKATGTHDHQETIDAVKSGELKHLMVTVAASIDGVEYGTAHLGSCVTKNLSTLVREDVHGYLDQLLDEAVENATVEIVDRYKKAYKLMESIHKLSVADQLTEIKNS